MLSKLLKNMEITMEEKENLNLESLKDIEERLKEIKDRSSELVKEHPLTSIVIAVGVGFIIAKLISRGRK
jgi:ElaB/YqjD/DUF883 family membrane-anchored ribosome-binding protein